MSKPAFAHQVICFDHIFDIVLMDTDSHAHVHVLRTFSHLAIYAKQVRPFQRFKSEIVEGKVTVIYNRTIEQVCVFFDDLHHVICEQRQ